jgi:SAM-dependent methyltransferase
MGGHDTSESTCEIRRIRQLPDRHFFVISLWEGLVGEDGKMRGIFDNLPFRFKTLLFRFRDLFSPRIDFLMGANLRPGFHVLDYGCSYGSYAIIAAEMVGAKGKVYALDSHPFAIDRVQKLATRRGLNNLQTILSNGTTGLRSASIDVVLLHEFSYSDEVLREIHRVLRPHGVLYFSDHQIRIRDDEVVPKLTNTGLFRLSRKVLKTFNFVKIG